MEDYILDDIEETEEKDYFTEEDDERIEEAILERLHNERLSYTYKIIKEEGNELTFQAIENEHYKMHIRYKSMDSGKEYTIKGDN